MEQPTGQVFPVAFEGQARDEFGTRSNRIGIIRLNLDEARESQELNIGGTMLWAIRASSNGAECTVQFQDYTSARVPYSVNQSIRGLRYSQLYISNNVQAGEWIEFLYAVESEGQLQIENPAQQVAVVTVEDGEVIVTNNVDTTVTEKVSPPTIDGTSTFTLDGTNQTVFSANVKRAESVIQSRSNNTGNVLIKDSAGKICAELQPGQSIAVTSSDALQVNGTNGDIIYGFETVY